MIKFISASLCSIIVYMPYYIGSRALAKVGGLPAHERLGIIMHKAVISLAHTTMKKNLGEYRKYRTF